MATIFHPSNNHNHQYKQNDAFISESIFMSQVGSKAQLNINDNKYYNNNNNNTQLLIQQQPQTTFTDQNNILNNQCSINSSDTLCSSFGLATQGNDSNAVTQIKQEELRRCSDSTESDQMDNVDEKERDEMGINYDDYTNQSYQYAEYDSEQERIVEEENEGKMQRFKGEQSFIFSMEGNDGVNRVQFDYLPVYKILSEGRESYLYGDVILECRYSCSDEKGVNSFCNWKQILQVQKLSNYVKLFANNKSSTSENFYQVIELYRSYQNKEMFEISELLNKFSQIYKWIKQALAQTQQYIDIFQKHHILQQRQQLFDQMSDQYLQNIPSHKIFFSIKNQPNFSALQIESSHICFSNNLLHLVNINIDQFINLILRGKAPEFFGHQTRLMFIRQKLFRYLGIPDQEMTEEVDLLTRDGLRVPARVKREIIKFDIDSLMSELTLERFQETMIVYYFEIDKNTINQIEYMRKNYSVEELNKIDADEIDFYTYSLETQAFLELYYSNITSSQSLQASQQKKKVYKKISPKKDTLNEISN